MDIGVDFTLCPSTGCKPLEMKSSEIELLETEDISPPVNYSLDSCHKSVALWSILKTEGGGRLI